MSDYIILFRFTDQGIKNIKEAPKRIQHAKETIEKAGAKIKLNYAVLGHFDTVFIIEAPNDEAIARIALQIGSLGNVHTETLRAFNEKEFLDIVNGIT